MGSEDRESRLSSIAPSVWVVSRHTPATDMPGDSSPVREMSDRQTQGPGAGSVTRHPCVSTPVLPSSQEVMTDRDEKHQEPIRKGGRWAVGQTAGATTLYLKSKGNPVWSLPPSQSKLAVALKEEEERGWPVA